MKVATRRLSTLLGALPLLLPLATLPNNAQAALNTSPGGWVAGMLSSGSAPYDHLDPSAGDNLVRTHDAANYRVGYTTVNGSDSNAMITLRAGAITLPSSYTGAAVDSPVYFDAIDIPTSCTNTSSNPVSEPPAAGVSGISADGQALFCSQPSPTNGNNLDFKLRLSGAIPNGATLTAPSISYTSDQSEENNSPQLLNGNYGTETFHGLPTLIVVAEPRWNLKVGKYRGGTYLPASGPADEDGFVFSASLGVMALGSRKGLEALQPPFDITLDFADSDFPNARIVDWNMQNPSYVSANFSSTGRDAHHGCGNWHNQLWVSGNSFDNRHYKPSDSGKQSRGLAFDVADGGDCSISSTNPTAQTAIVSTVDTDFSLQHWPSKRGRSAAADDLVNPANADDSLNEWWVANKSILIWVPEADISLNTTEFMTLNAALAGTSISGQGNTEPDGDDNQVISAARRSMAGNLYEIHTPPVWSNPYGLDYSVRDPVHSGDSHVNQVAPNQVLAARLSAYNYGTGALPAGYICDRIDNTRLSLFDTRDPAYTSSASNRKDPSTGLFVRHLSGPEFPVTWQLGVSTPWSSYNTQNSEYARPATAGSQQSDTGCSDTEATWYDSIAALLAAEGSDALQRVTHVRGSYDSYPAGSRLLVYIPQQARADYAYSGMDNPGGTEPGGVFAAGDTTVGSMAVHQMLWQTNEPALFSTGLGKSSDAVRIFQTEYARIAKVSASHLPSGSLANAGAVIHYALTVNLSTSGSTHQSDAVVWDVIPAHLNYLPNSTTFGGASLPDPVCSSTGLPAELFPAADGQAAGSLAAGYRACRWSLSNQQVRKVSIGHASANLPTLEYSATVALSAPGSTQILTSGVATSSNNLIPLPEYSGAGNGFGCLPRKACSFSNWLTNIQATPGVILNKQVSSATIEPDQTLGYSLSYGAIGQSLTALRIIDIFPHATDGRFPASTHSGTLNLQSPVAAPAANTALSTSSDANFIALYTRQTPSQVNADPYSDDHQLTGTATNTSSSTNWCNTTQFGTTDCPATIGDSTAAMFLPDGANGAAANISEGHSYRIKMHFDTAGNVLGNRYSNHFTADSPSLTARRPSSNTVTSRVKAPDLSINKTVTPDTAEAGTDVSFEITVSNHNNTDSSPLYQKAGQSVRVIDALPSGMTLLTTTPLAAGWDCSATASNTVDCSYTGSFPIGIGAAIGAPIVINARLDNDVFDNAWLKNHATVTLVGGTETDTSNNSSEAWVRARRAVDISLSKTVDQSTATQTESVLYTLSASLDAEGGRALNGPITVTDTLPAGLLLQSSSDITASDWDCSASTLPSHVQCDYTGSYPLAPGTAIGGDITVSARIADAAPLGPIINIATVATPGERDTSNNTASATFEILPAMANITGRVFVDSNADATASPSEQGLQGQTLTLCRVSTTPCDFANTVDTATTDTDGNYGFENVASGSFYIIQTQAAGFGSSTDNTVAVLRAANAPVNDVDFGETLGRISGYVYVDVDQSGNRATAGENGTGAAVEIVLSGTIVDPISGLDTALELRASADPTTGAYAFDNIPAPKAGTHYRLQQSPQTVAGFSNGSTRAGTINASTGSGSVLAGLAASASSEVTHIGFRPAAAAVQAPTIDGQNYNFGELPQAGISGRVYLDNNHDGLNSSSDPGIEGVSMILCVVNELPCSAANTVDTVQTAPDGAYLFNAVPAGSFFVQQLQPLGYGSITANALPITRSGDIAANDVDFGERGAVVSGQVFIDQNRSGARDVDDADYTGADAVVWLSGTNTNGQAVALIQTVDALGRYSFDGLMAPDAAGYTLSIDGASVTDPYYVSRAHLGALLLANGSNGNYGSVDGLAITALNWVTDSDITTTPVATGLGYDFSVMSGVTLGGHVMRDIDRDNSGNTSTDSDDAPQAGVTLTLCRSDNSPCPSTDTVDSTVSNADGSYQFDQVVPGSYWIIEEQPTALGNGPGATDSISAAVGVTALTELDFLDRAGALSGTVFRDNNADGINSAEPGIAGVTITLTGTDIDGNTVALSTLTDTNGSYRFVDLPAANAAGFTLSESGEPADTRDGRALPGDTLDAEDNTNSSTGSASNPDTITGIHLVPGGAGSDFDFSELPATASVSGSVWRDRDSDRTYANSESAVPGWTVQLLHIDPVDGGTTLVAEQQTGQDGSYNFSGQIPGEYQIIFRAPTTDANSAPAIWGTPVNGERGVPVANSNADIADGIIRSITLRADEHIAEQSLPLDPSGVIYNSVERSPVPGTAVSLVGPAGFNPALHLLGGAAASAQTTGATGEYQFLLLATAPAGEYSLSIAPPAGYQFESQLIPAEAGSFTPPNNPAAVHPMVPSELAPLQGAPTTYYTRFNLTPGSSSGVVHNHIPLDPDAVPVLFVSKQVDRSEAELGDSIKYTVRMHNRGEAAAPALSVEDILPLGFKYIGGTAKLQRGSDEPSTQSDPAGAPGPALVFAIPGSLEAGSDLQLSYRVRIGVGAERGDGINYATGLTGALRSERASARVEVGGGVLGAEACLAGRVFVDCNNNHVQDSEELGIPGVRLYMEDGRSLVSDVEGKYSSCDLTPQSHVLKVDPMTLPRGSRLTTSSSRNVGDATSLFVDLSNGELQRADFIEGSCSNTVLEQVRARRANSEVLRAHIEARGAPSLSQRSNAHAIHQGTVSANQALVRQRPVTNDSVTALSHTQNTPRAAQDIQQGAPYADRVHTTPAADLYWDSSALHNIELQLPEQSALADGLSAVDAIVRLLDQHGEPLFGRQLVTVIASGGHVWLPGADTHENSARAQDLDPTAPGVQAWAENGSLRFLLLAPDQPQQVSIKVTAADHRAESKIDFLPVMRDWIAAGLIEGTVRLSDKGGFSASQGQGLFERELQQFQQAFNNDKAQAAGRIAFFVKGTVQGKYLLTATYDSEKEARARILQNIKADALYPVFGDASIKGFEAQSSHKLFVRLSRDKHFLLYGDFQSESGDSDLGAHPRTLTGGRLHLENQRGLLDVYAANDSLRQQVEELTPNGTSGPYGIKGLAVENTERVELIVRDRDLRSRILERRVLTRHVDYSFDPFSGRLLFKTPVSRFAENGHPQSLRVSYEQDGSGPNNWASGVRAEAQISEMMRIGASYSHSDLDQAISDQLTELASLDIAVALNDWVNMRAELAQSTTLAADGSGEFSGGAARVELSTAHPSGSWSAALHAVQSDVDFRNSNASVDTGRGEIGLSLNSALNESFSLNTELQRSTDDSTRAQIDSAYAGLKLRPREGFAVAAGIRHVRDNGRGLINSAEIQSNGSVYSGSGLNSAGAGLFSSGEALTSSVDSDTLNTTTLLLGSDWAVSEKLALGAEVEHSVAGDQSWRATATAGWRLNDTQQLSARYETQTGLGSAVDRRQTSRAFVFGLTRNFDADGSNFSELRLRDSIGGREAHLAYGIRNGFDLGAGLRGMASAEQVAILDGEGRTASSAALGLSYPGGERWKGNARLEGRRLHDNDATATRDSADSWLGNISVARKLDSSWTALAKYITLSSDDAAQAGKQSQQRVQVGAAYRPVDNNRVAVLAQLERKRERNSELLTAESRDVWVASVNSNWHPTRAWWLGARLATKDVDESLEGVRDRYRASLIGVRAGHDISERTDVGFIANYKYSPDGHTRDWAAGVQAGYAVQTNLWLSLGYNWGGFSDRELSGSDYTQRGWYIRLRYKFDEDVFAATSTTTNRSLARSTDTQESKK